MKQLTLTFLLTWMAGWATGQVCTREIPPSWNLNEAFKQSAPTVVDASKVQPAEYAAGFHGGAVHYAGERIRVNFTTTSAGTWTAVNGGMLWQHQVVALGADKISGYFSKYDLAPGQRLFISNGAHTHVIGALTDYNNKPDGGLSFVGLPGDVLEFELFIPTGTPTPGLELGAIDVIKSNQNVAAGACHQDAICALDPAIQQQARAVGIITIGGAGICTGTLLNNNCDNGRLLFLTAGHCMEVIAPSAIAIDFGYEATSCDGQEINFAKAIAGARLLASGENTDFALLELLEDAPPGYDLHFAGWDNTDNLATSSTCIHHPDAEVKKLAVDQNAVEAFSGDVNGWEVVNWESGATEPGSSGAALFNQNSHVVGQLFGGFSACGVLEPDYFGRFDASWDYGTRVDEQLAHWLSPCNTSSTTHNGTDVYDALRWYDLSIISLENMPFRACEDIVPVVRVKNIGTQPVDGLTINVSNGTETFGNAWSGILPAGATQAVIISNMPALTPGAHTLTFELDINSQVDEDLTNNSRTHDITILEDTWTATLELQLDNYAYETSWELIDPDGFMISGGGPYAEGDSLNIVTADFGCLIDGEHTFKIYDLFGDGLSGVGVLGSVAIRDSSGAILAEITADEANFEYAASLNFSQIPAVQLTDDLGLTLVDWDYSKTIVEFDIAAKRDTDHEVLLVNPLGQLVLRMDIPKEDLGYRYQFDTSTYPAGVYTLQLWDSRERVAKKFVVIGAGD